MIKAEHRKWALLVYYPYIYRLMRKHFSNYYLVNEFPEVDKNAGLIITPNHNSWWDGFFIQHVCRKFLKRRLYLMMLEKQLKRFWFFRKVGTYSINPENAKSIINTATYTAGLISDPQSAVIIYPQGEIEPFEKRPLSLKKGLQLFTRRAKNDFYILPAGFKIQYYNEKKPSIIARFGKLLSGDIIQNDFRLFEKEFTRNLDMLSQAAFDKTFTKDLFGKPK
jgi:1-acyl-sn-glycerol-3-phosphate acyltransferase